MNPNPGDPPPDAAPLGLKLKPPYEIPEDLADWDRVAATPEFKELLKAKARFITPACIFFLVYYFALLVSVGYAPQFMKTKVIGVVNLAYLFALSQFFMAWIIAALYVRAAARHDEMATRVVRKAKGPL